MNHFAQLAVILAFLGLQTLVSAHMEMTWPPPLKSKVNPFAANDVDHDMTSPLSASGSDFPCKGYLSLLGSEAAQPVASYQAGETYNLTIGGGANHNGGSCQASLSFDGGQTFKVIKSYVGGCPPSGVSQYDFTIPEDTPSADDAIFAWTWFNQVGNREMYMNCAVVSTSGGGNAKRQTSAFSSRPEILVANVGNGCSTSEGTDVEFPNPGPDVVEESSGTSPPQGNCGGGGNGGNGGNGGDNGNGNDGGNQGAPVPSDAPAPAPTTTTPVGEAPLPTASTLAPEQPDSEPTRTLPGGIFLPQPSTEGSPQPSTLSTITTIAGLPTTTGGNATVPAPTNTPETPANPPSSGGGAAGTQDPGSACGNEGEWNCVGGNQFQRCASGAWSALIPMADGTSCETGFSETLVWVKKRGGARRMMAH